MTEGGGDRRRVLCFSALQAATRSQESQVFQLEIPIARRPSPYLPLADRDPFIPTSITNRRR